VTEDVDRLRRRLRPALAVVQSVAIDRVMFVVLNESAASLLITVEFEFLLPESAEERLPACHPALSVTAACW